ncbi:HNH endonuclease signature motif containing protein [Microbacterium sp. NIBRBAC000506063]|uniref:HNH endonuclease signature motif containing protein n=1 Tax=Microbacterium sp. NIBRBAC000506063 TaxID=2734618 RepID=UPI001BB729D0|nr:HNH endonuclease signature motif containing protein [Microbacterium sp. NIBRBAC000506063]QTV80248.1 DUF222 domain-containing protein [Microbacterium sp. NIBRBAC000506063]
MTFLGDLNDGLQKLAQFAELDVDAAGLAVGACELSDESVRLAFSAVAELSRDVQKLEAVLAGVIAQRSTRQAGHAGLAQAGGFRSPVQMVQEVAGVPKGEAIRVIRVGASLVESDDAASSGDSAEPVASATREPWHRPLGQALIRGEISRAQHDVIRRGLGEPPEIPGCEDDDVIQVWRLAAEQLVSEASGRTVEDLAASARAARDLIDPAGAERRWEEHYAQRSFRMRVDAEGRTHGHIVFDDEAAAWWRSVLDAALRPRRGGPRFASDDKDAVADLIDDPRSNEQLAYDLVTDLFRAGTLAEAEEVFGVRQAGVRVVTVAEAAGPRDAFGRLLAVAHTEDGHVPLPGSVLERALCETGTVAVAVDACGNPLNVGRERRLFNATQRLALAVRDGGCMWPGCDRPPSYSEAHHIDPYSEGGCTDIDRGILLCRYHHLHLHNAGWKITREGKGSSSCTGRRETGENPSRSDRPRR